MSNEIPKTGDDATDTAIADFEAELIRHCYAKNWPAVNIMIGRVTLLADIAKDLYQIDQGGGKCVLQ